MQSQIKIGDAPDSNYKVLDVTVDCPDSLLNGCAEKLKEMGYQQSCVSGLQLKVAVHNGRRVLGQPRTLDIPAGKAVSTELHNVPLDTGCMAVFVVLAKVDGGPAGSVALGWAAAPLGTSFNDGTAIAIASQ